VPIVTRPDVDPIELELLLSGIFTRYGHDFRRYARASILRRAARALEVLGLGSLSELHEKVFADEALFVRLLGLLTVSTTELFRDPQFYVALRERVLPYLRTYPSLRLWVAGCSSGEEVLSLCIVLDEAGLLERTLVYATDINPLGLERARKGIYRDDEVGGSARGYHAAGGRRSLSDYYTADYGSALFHPRLLERVVFTEHSLATDGVFSEVQLVSCRNVLIYFERPLQDRALGLFAESLCHRGFLCLGARETLRLSEHRRVFEAVPGRDRIYQKR